MSETCATCRFFAAGSKDPPEGECRRHAPVPWLEDAPDGEKAAWWPIVYGDAWCGEHQPREAEPKAREPGWYWVRPIGTLTDNRWVCAEYQAEWWYGEAELDGVAEVGPRLEPPA